MKNTQDRMTQFMLSVRRYMTAHPEQRYGQAMVNVLWSYDEEAYKLFCSDSGLDTDPFYNSEKSRNLLSALAAHWSK